MPPLDLLVAAAGLLVIAILAFGIAVWFGRRVVAPRIERALDRAESEDDGDRDG